jgi:Cation transporting ATPase, C-terminus
MGNRYLAYGILAVVILQFLFTYAPPFEATFGTEPVPLWVWPRLLAGGLAFFSLLKRKSQSSAHRCLCARPYPPSRPTEGGKGLVSPPKRRVCCLPP